MPTIGAPWTPDKFPNPAVDVNSCGRGGHFSRICDPDSVLTATDGDGIDQSLNDIAVPVPPYVLAANGTCSHLPAGRKGLQVGHDLPLKGY